MKKQILKIATLCLGLVATSSSYGQLAEITSPSGYNTAVNKGYGGYDIEYNGKMYMRYKGDDGNNDLMEYDGNNFTTISSPAGYDGAGAGYEAIEPVVINNILYMIYKHNSGRYDLAKFDGTNLTFVVPPSSHNTTGFSEGEYLNYNPSTNIIYLSGIDNGGNIDLFTYDGTTLVEVSSPYVLPNKGYYANTISIGTKTYCKYLTDLDVYVLAEIVGNSAIIIPLSGYDASSKGLQDEPIEYNGDIYLKYEQNNGNKDLVKLTPSTNTLTVIPSPLNYDLNYSGYEGKPFISNNKLCLAYADAPNEYYHLFTYDGTSLVEIIPPLTYQNNQGYYPWNDNGQIIHNNEYYSVYGADNGESHIFKFDGTTITPIPSTAGSESQGQFHIMNGDLYSMQEENVGDNSQLVKYDGTTLSTILSPAGFTGQYKGLYGDEDNTMFTHNNILYLKYRSDLNIFHLLTYDGTIFGELTTPQTYTGTYTGYLGSQRVYNNDLYFNFQGADDNFDLHSNRSCSVTTSSFPVVACNSYTVPSGDETHTIAGTYNDTIQNASGCDSIMTITLTLNKNTGIDVLTECDSYTWIDGNTYTTSNNTATHALTNIAGCDSVVTLNLTINNSNTGIDTQVACDTYQWINGITYTSSNNTATYTLMNAIGCDSIITLNLTINISPILTITTNPIPLCAEDSLTLIATGASAIVWSDGIVNGQTFLPVQNQTYTVNGTTNGCTSTAQIPVVINQLPIIEATASTVTSCEGEAIYFSANGGLSYTYQTTDFNVNEWFTPITSGSFTYKVEGLGANGCVGTGEITVLVNPTPSNPTVSATIMEACIGLESVNPVIATSANGTTEWFTDGAITNMHSQENTLNPTTDNEGRFMYYATQNVLGCNSTGVAVTVIVNPLPVVNAGYDRNELSGVKITLEGTTNADSLYYWTDENLVKDVNDLNTSLVTTETNTYTLYAIDTKGCENTSSFNIIVEERLIIANYISPNGDEKNDVWKVFPLSSAAKAKFLVYDGFGRVVFESEGYNNTWSADGLPDGDYYYIIDLNGQILKGAITLLR